MLVKIKHALFFLIIFSLVSCSSLLERNTSNSETIKSLHQTCLSKKDISCDTVGALELHKNNIESATKFFSIACANNVFESCTGLGLIEQQKGNLAKALIYFQKACDGKQVLACNKILIQKHNNYYKSKILPFFTEKCSGGADNNACNEIGKIEYIYGNFPEAIKFFKKACKANVYEACYELGFNLTLRGLHQGAEVLYKRACEKGKIQLACEALSIAH